jgi:hypothetical protein
MPKRARETAQYRLKESLTMSKFSIAFVAPEEEKPLKHRILESNDQETALKLFFEEEISEFYSNDDQGYHYFKEDFFDTSTGVGSIITCE